MKRDWFNLKNGLSGCLLLWAFVQAALLLRLGAQLSIDSDLYISDANNLLNGIIPEGKSIWYISYSSFLACIFFFGGGPFAVVIIQVLLSGVAAWCLYLLVIEIGEDKYVALLTVLLYVAWIKIHEWNTILYTESLFTSCSIISFTCLMRSKKSWHFMLTLLTLLFTFFIRPTGMAFLIGLFFYFLLFMHGKMNKKLIGLVCLSAFGVILFLMSMMLDGVNLISSYSKAEVIYPDISLGLEPPTVIGIPNEKHPTIIRLVEFAFYNPVYFSKLFILKLSLFFGNVKPYFSPIHNSVIVLVLYPLYWFASKGFIYFKKQRKEKYFIAGYVVSQASIVALTTENWDGRFLIPLLPFIFLLSAKGLSVTFNLTDTSKVSYH